MAYWFGKSFNRRSNHGEKRHQKESNVKKYHTCTRNRLKFLFSTDRNSIIAVSCTHTKITRYYDFVAKVTLVDADGCQAFVYVVRNSNTMLNMKIANDDDDVMSINMCEPIWDKDKKYYIFNDDHISSGY